MGQPTLTSHADMMGFAASRTMKYRLAFMERLPFSRKEGI
jgi:hypothetical protein